MEFQAVVLCDLEPSDLHPLVPDGSNVCLLQVITRPLLWYPLQALHKARASSAIIVLREGANVTQVKSWLTKEDSIPPCEVVVVSNEATTGDIVRVCLPRLSEATVVFVRLGLITDLSFAALLVSYFISTCAATMVLKKRKMSAAAQTKTGRAPTGVEYTAMDLESQRLLFYSAVKETIKQIKLPYALLQDSPHVKLTTDYYDSGLYVFSKDVLVLFEKHDGWNDFSSDLIPHLLTTVKQEMPSVESGTGEGRREVKKVRGGVSVVLPTAKEYLSKISTSATYSEICKDLLSVELRTHLVGLSPSKEENLVQSDVHLGNKATVSGTCLVMEGTHLEDKVSIKRSLISKNCRIGNGSKIINSIVLDSVVVGDGAHIQNSVLSAESTIGHSCQIKDSLIGCGYHLGDKMVSNEEVLPCKKENKV